MKARRRRFSAEERDQFVELYRKSDLTQVEFARTHQLKLGTLLRWIYRRDKPRRSARPTFQELVIPAGAAVTVDWMEISIGPEITVRMKAMTPPEWIARFIQQLRKPW